VKRVLALVAVAAAAATPAAAHLAAGRGTIATVAAVDHPRGLAVVHDGSLVVAEPFANRVERVSPRGVEPAAGTGVAGFAGDGGPATAARLNFVHGVAPMPDGGFVLADTLNERIRRVFPDGTIDTVAGRGVEGYGGDGGPATAAAIADPRGVATFPDGRILIPDTDNNRIRLVELDGTIRTVAGDGTAGFAGDGGPATSAELRSPFGVAPLPDGGFLVDDSGNSRIRRVSSDGVITTVAGNGVRGDGGDGGPAVEAELDAPHNVVSVPGGFVVADTGNHRVRLVRGGVISTLAGTGVAGFSGDGGLATAAQLDQPKALALVADGSLLIADSENDRVRLVDAGLRPPLALHLTTRSIRVRSGAPIRIRYRLGAPARVRVRVLRGRKLVTSAAASGRTGANVLVLRKRLRAGRYRLELTATAPGATDRASGRLTVTRR
jgi:hypothetical protein